MRLPAALAVALLGCDGVVAPATRAPEPAAVVSPCLVVPETVRTTIDSVEYVEIVLHCERRPRPLRPSRPVLLRPADRPGLLVPVPGFPVTEF